MDAEPAEALVDYTPIYWGRFNLRMWFLEGEAELASVTPALLAEAFWGES
jgi:hypothetical protein